MSYQDILSVVCVYLKVDSSSNYNVLSLVNKQFFKEFQIMKNVNQLFEWFKTHGHKFLTEKRTSWLFENLLFKTNNSIKFTMSCGTTRHNFSKFDFHECVITFNENSSVELFVKTKRKMQDEQFELEADFRELDEEEFYVHVCRTFGNIRSLEELKRIFRTNSFKTRMFFDNKVIYMSNIVKQYGIEPHYDNDYRFNE